MISYFILNKSGTILYHSGGEPLDNTDSSRIRYLPLLLIKDLIKVNLHNSIQHVRSGGKLVTFWEVSRRTTKGDRDSQQGEGCKRNTLTNFMFLFVDTLIEAQSVVYS